jgi:hypothetical protein
LTRCRADWYGPLDVQSAQRNVIPVDFAARRRQRARMTESPAVAMARTLTGGARDYLLFWRPPARRAAAEYLGSKWSWGWTLFVWTDESLVRAVRPDLGARGYHAQWLTREGFITFLDRATEIGGLLLDGELEDAGDRIRAEPLQLVRREDALAALRD